MHIREFVQNPPQHPFYAVIGHPVQHSKSPLLHNYALKKLGLPGTYYALDTPVDAFAWVGNLLSLSGFRGLNVTIPHKSRIMDLLSMVDPLAQAAGAVNTVHRERIGFAGYNTDITGIQLSLKEHALLFTGQNAIILGSGGAARAAVAALKPFRVNRAVVISRNPSKTKWPGSINHVPVHVDEYKMLETHISKASLIINTTPVGMHPETGESPVPAECIPLLKGKICMDAIYNPVQTQFLKQAGTAGAAATINGVKMFTGQAAAAFNIWTGKSFPVKEAEAKLMESLQSDEKI